MSFLKLSELEHLATLLKYVGVIKLVHRIIL